MVVDTTSAMGFETTSLVCHDPNHYTKVVVLVNMKMM
jgi:hypothetical protein